MTLLVTAASGQLGRLVVESLLARGVAASDIRAGARDVSKIVDLAERGVQTVHLDYTDAASATEAVAGVERVLLISGTEFGRRVAQHRTVLDAAVAAGVAQLVYTSAPKVDTSDIVVAPEHKATEEAIRTSGIGFTILRNNWYTENYLRDLAQVRETGVLLSSAGDGRVASASRRDYAEAAAVVLTTDGHLGKVYELAGDEAWTFATLAETFAELLGRDVELRSVSSDEHRAILAGAGLPEGAIDFVVGLDASIRGGALADATGELSALIGRPTTPLAEGLRAGL